MVHTPPRKKDPVQYSFWLPPAFLALDKMDLTRKKVREQTNDEIDNLDIAMPLRHFGAVRVQ